MIISNIISRRKVKEFFWNDIVYEWEDILSQELHLEIICIREKWTKGLLKKIPFAYYFATKRKFFLQFDMTPSTSMYDNISNKVSCIIDFWYKDRLYRLNKGYYFSKVLLISSKEAYEYLKDNGCKLNIKHWALSISDKYKINEDTKFEKKYDLVLMGRTNPVMLEWVKRYANTHSSFEYIYREPIDDKLIYVSNKGNVIGDFSDREKYMKLMSYSKVGLYATPGIDKGKDCANGFNQVTPRFLEYIANGCHILARYPKNPDTDYYELNKFCPNIETYEQFEDRLNEALDNPVDMIKYSQYLSKHYTSVRAKELKEIIQSI